MAIIGNQKSVRCESCKRTMRPNRVEAGGQTKVALIVAGQLMPLQCTSCSRVVCHECQGGQRGVGASHISMFCQSCNQMMDVLGYSPGAGGSSSSAAANGGRGAGVLVIVIAIAAIAGAIYFMSGR